MITVYDDAPEQNKELKERGTTDAGRLCLRAVGEPLGKIKAAAGALLAAKAFCLPLTSELGLTAVRSRSRENNTQLFSNTLAPLRYALCAECRTHGLQYPKPKNIFFEHYCLHIVRIFRENAPFFTLFPLFPYRTIPVVVSYVVKPKIRLKAKKESRSKPFLSITNRTHVKKYVIDFAVL